MTDRNRIGTPFVRIVLTAFALLALSLHPALAHQGTGVAQGFSGGFLHPLLGPDHLVAMVAVGLWGAQLGNPAIWVLPVAFPLVMAFGGLLGILGAPLFFPETIIAASAITLGAVVALRLRVPFYVAAVVVGIFALFHGYSHGKELPHAADPASYAIGFVIATGLLHLVGILIGTVQRWPGGVTAVRTLGAAIAVLGFVFLSSTLGDVG